VAESEESKRNKTREREREREREFGGGGGGGGGGREDIRYPIRWEESRGKFSKYALRSISRNF
jgi:hypothetical protein